MRAVRVSALVVATFAATLAVAGSAQAVKLVRVQGHVLSVPVDCTLAANEGAIGVVGPAPVCRVGSAAECHNVVVPGYSQDQGCGVAAGPLLTACGDSYSSGTGSATGCLFSLMLGDQGIAFACGTGRYDPFGHTSGQEVTGCSGVLALGGSSIDLACRDYHSIGGDASNATLFCGVPSQATGCTLTNYSYANIGIRYSARDAYCTVNSAAVARLMCIEATYDYDQGANRDDCVVYLFPPGGPTCTVAVVNPNTPATVGIDPSRTGCV